MIVVSSIALFLAIIWAVLFRKKHGGFYNGKEMKSWMAGTRIVDISASHTTVTGVLSGFAITIVVLLIDNEAPANSGIPSGTSLSMFIVAFFGYVAAGLLYSLVAERETLHRAFLFSIASICYFLSVVLSFSALLPLLSNLSAPNLPLISLAFLIISSAIGGHLAVFIPLSDGFRLRQSAVGMILILTALVAFTFLSIIGLLSSPNIGDFIAAAVVFLPTATFAICFLISTLSFFYNRVSDEMVLRWLAVGLACWSTFVVMFIAFAVIGALDVFGIPMPVQGKWLSAR